MNLMETTQGAVRAIADSFENPDDDFLPVASFETAGGIRILDMAPFMENDTGKELLAEVILPAMIKKLEAIRVVTVLSAWAVQAGKDYFENDEPMPSKHPDRIEVVIVTEMDADGVTSIHTSYINRDPFMVNPPTLSEFDVLNTAEATAQFEGRFVDPIIAALKEVRHG